MDKPVGYLYLRRNEYYDMYNVCKVGTTTCLSEQDVQDTMNEIKKGYYERVFEIEVERMGRIEQQLRREFAAFQVKYDAGTHFYDRQIVDSIELFFKHKDIPYRIVTPSQICSLIDCVCHDQEKNEETIMYKTLRYFQEHDKGILCLMYGLRKIHLTLRLCRELNCNRILIGVSSHIDATQWEQMVCSVFPEIPYILVSDKVEKDTILCFLERVEEKCIVLLTYSSVNTFTHVSQQLHTTFDMKILDNVHYIIQTRIGVSIMTIPYEKQLSLTATKTHLKSLSTKHFGELVDRKELSWALTNKLVCDYTIQTIITDEDQLSKFRILEEENKRLFFSAFVCLKSMFEGQSHHVVMYLHTNDHSFNMMEYIQMLLDIDYFEIPNLYYSRYHSGMDLNEQNDILQQFRTRSHGILICTYGMMEEYTFPMVNGIVFVENRISDNCILPLVLNPFIQYTHQHTYIILPVLNKDDWLDNPTNSDFVKVKTILSKLREEDDSSIQKIRVYRVEMERQKTKGRNKMGEYEMEVTHKLKTKIF